ncbi:MAG: ATP-binding cassette domain-containing protein, partial [Selenomonas sp.]|nr:ATP-binding cassette domain-containing protein [Selenomonas sp.]
MTASAHETILRIEHLTKHFPLEGGKVLTACDDVTFPVYRGDILGIVGESGCGKSTLVRTLM